MVGHNNAISIVNLTCYMQRGFSTILVLILNNLRKKLLQAVQPFSGHKYEM